MCASLRETRREYGHVASSSTSLSPTVSRRDTHILTPPQARRPASGAEASTHPLGLASWKGLAQDGTVGDRDVDDKAPWMGSRRVPTWAWPFSGAPQASGLSLPWARSEEGRVGKRWVRSVRA